MTDIVQAIPWPDVAVYCTPSLLLGFALGYFTGRRNHSGGTR